MKIAGAALIIGILYVGSDVLIPLALAILLSFVLGPVVSRLGAWRVPRAVAVVLVTAMVFSGLAAFGLLIGVQVVKLANELPSYQRNIQVKLEDTVQAAPSGGAIARITGMVGQLRASLESAPAAADAVPRVQLQEPADSPVAAVAEVAGGLAAPLGKAGLVLVLVIFMLLERQALRDRLLRLLGPDLRVTTEALDEAGYRVSRYLLMQLVVNITYAVAFGVGLYIIGIPNASLWAGMAVLLRFIPYLGPVMAAAFPLILAIAIDAGWSTFVLTLSLIVVLELISSNILEPQLYGASTSMSTVAIIFAAVFWTSLWGFIGLLLATPLTVCLAVAGRYVPSLRFLDVMLGSAPALSLPERFYQRLLAGDVDENMALAEHYLEEHTLVSFYDEVVLPALALAARDSRDRHGVGERSLTVTRTALQIIGELADHPESGDLANAPGAGAPVGETFAVNQMVLCAAGRTGLDLAAANVLAQLLERQGYSTRVMPADAITAGGPSEGEVERCDALCLSFLDDVSLLRAQQMSRRLVRVVGPFMVLGCWLRDEQQLRTLALPKGAVAVSTLRAALQAVDEALAPAPGSYQAPGVPLDEEARLRDLRRLRALEQQPQNLTRWTRKLAAAFDVPIALVTIVDEDSQHFRVQTGLPHDLATAGRSDRDTSICGHVVADNEILVVEDALRDPRFANNPFLLEQGIRFYAGAPLRSAAGHVLGSVCVVDAMPRKVSLREQALLQMIADEVMRELEAGEQPAGLPAADPEVTLGSNSTTRSGQADDPLGEGIRDV